VIFSTPVAVMGGAERALLDLVRSLRRSSPEVRVEVVVGAAGPLVAALEALGVVVTVLPLPRSLLGVGERGGARTLEALAIGPDLARYLRRLRALLRDRRPDVVHTNGMKAHVLTTIAAVGVAPVVWHVRDFVSSRPLATRLLRRLAPLARAAIAVSGAVSRDLRAHVGTVSIHVVHDAVDLDTFNPAPTRPRGWLDAVAGANTPDAGVLRVGLVATYARWKGHQTFLEAAARLPATLPARFYLVGGPIYATAGSQLTREELRASARALGVDDRLVFVDFQHDASLVYHDLDVVVHASSMPEPFGLTIAEAMSCGRAVVASRTAGCLEVMTAGEDLLSVAPGDADELAAAIAALVEDEGLRRRLGASAAAVARRELDARGLGPAVLDVYRSAGLLPGQQRSDEAMAYDDRFYDEMSASAGRSAKVVVPLVLDLVRPRRVIDVGCGVGTWLSVFREHGCEVVGIDGDWVAERALAIPRECFIRHDLEASPPPAVGRFDLVVCLELAEHLSSDRADGLIDGLTGYGPVVMFSAAIPHQGGAHHVNEQWPEYWAARFATRGFVPLDVLRWKLWDHPEVSWFYKQNALLFVAREKLEELPWARDAAQAACVRAPLAVVHPSCLENLMTPPPPPGVKDQSRALLEALERSVRHRLGRLGRRLGGG
jgi:glycosyltransferase involved in cell wall biosynthesis/SAM-dependent methyltransferase